MVPLRTINWYTVATKSTKKILFFLPNQSTPLKTFTAANQIKGLSKLLDDTFIVTTQHVLIGLLAYVRVYDRTQPDGNTTPVSSNSLGLLSFIEDLVGLQDGDQFAYKSALFGLTIIKASTGFSNQGSMSFGLNTIQNFVPLSGLDFLLVSAGGNLYKYNYTLQTKVVAMTANIINISNLGDNASRFILIEDIGGIYHLKLVNLDLGNLVERDDLLDSSIAEGMSICASKDEINYMAVGVNGEELFNKAEACDPSCLTCTENYNPQKCLTCLVGSLLRTDYTCGLVCYADEVVDKNDPSICKKCEENEIIQEGECVCLNGYHFSKVDLEC